MSNGNVEIKFNQNALKEVVGEGVRQMIEDGEVSFECPSCGANITIQFPETACPHCDYRFQVNIGEVEL